MKTLHTEIQINSSSEKIWQILTDFEQYPAWNPLVKSIVGDLKLGSSLQVVLQQPESSKMKIKPNIVRLRENIEFGWMGQLLFPGIFDGEHIFELKDLGDGTTKFIQRENFKGILVGLFWKMLDTKTRKGFELMNAALKQRAESL